MKIVTYLVDLVVKRLECGVPEPRRRVVHWWRLIRQRLDAIQHFN
jgi:hypothetical protein